MGRKWGNSYLEANIKYIACHYCGLPIKDKTRFKIKRMNSHAFTFCSQTCEKIWDKKTGYGRRPKGSK